MESWTFEAIGTAWQIDTQAPLAPEVRDLVADRIERFDRDWSRFRDDSFVSAVAREAGDRELPEDAESLFDFYTDLHEVTDGAVNPLVGRALSDLGYDAGYSLTPSATPTAPTSWSTIDWGGADAQRRLRTDEPMLIDVGAAGKGLLVDHVASILWAEGLRQATVDAGGDLYHCGTTPIRVALEHPHDPTKALGVVELEPEDALCGSATNRRAWGDGLHHVLDARTGRPTTDVVATWVLAPQSCMLADGLATAHFFAEPERLLERWHHQFVRMHADGRVVWSPDLQGEVFA